MIFNLFTPSNAIDTITKTNLITDSKKEALISSNGSFKLGFFSPGNSLGRYVGIWFNKVSKQTVVLVANRKTPLKNSTGTFKITKDGNLAVFDGNKSTPIWSTNISMPSTNATAKLLPSGNLVLVVENKSCNAETVLWQSFDHPTDTVLLGMKFWMNQKTVLNLVLTFWKSSDDPASGEFSFRLDPQGLPQFILYKNSSPHWRGGPWNGRTLNGLPDIATRLKTYEVDYSNQIDTFNYTYVNNHNEIYVTFTARNNTIFSIMVYAICGEQGGGCGYGEGEGFVRLASSKVPDARFSRAYGNMSLQECERECLKSCNCTGYASADVSGSGNGCIAWYGELTDTRQYEDGQYFYLRVDAVELAAYARENSKGNPAKKRTLVFIIVPIVLVVLLLVAGCYYLWRKHAQRRGNSKS